MPVEAIGMKLGTQVSHQNMNCAFADIALGGVAVISIYYGCCKDDSKGIQFLPLYFSIMHC